jgi:uncharacterized membrane protein
MTYKQYRAARLVVVFILAALFSQAIVREQFFVPVAVLAIGVLVMFWLRSRLKEVAADERDYHLGGKAALLAIQVYAWIAVICMFAFYAQKNASPVFEALGMMLAYSTCGLLLLYSAIFYYYRKHGK